MTRLLLAAVAALLLAGCHPVRVPDTIPGLRTPDGCVFVAAKAGPRGSAPTRFVCGNGERLLQPPPPEPAMSLLELGRLTVQAWTPTQTALE